MDVIFSAIAPALLLLGGGIVLHRRAPLDESFWTGLSWISYWVFTPSLFITAISSTDLSALSPGPLLLSLAASITTSAVLVLIA